MNGLSEFLAMGGYGAFVWPSFGIVAIVLIGLWLQSARALKKAEAALADMNTEGRGQR